MECQRSDGDFSENRFENQGSGMVLPGGGDRSDEQRVCEGLPGEHDWKKAG